MPGVPQERVQNRVAEQIVGVPVPHITEDGLPIVPHERVHNRSPEQIALFPGRQIVEECVQNRTLEQISGSLVPQTMEAVIEVLPPTPQESVQNRVGEQIVDSVPRVMEAVAGVVRATPQERVQNRPRKLFVDVPVPQIAEQTAGKVMRTEKVFAVLHHRDEQAWTVDTLGFNTKGLDKCTMPRSGDVMVPALHMVVPVPQIAEDIVERPGKPLFLLSYFGVSGKGPSRWGGRGRGGGRDLGFELIFNGYVAEIRCEGPRAWHPLDLFGVLLPVLRGRLNLLGTGSGAWHPLTPSWVPWCASTTVFGGCGGDPACAYCCEQIVVFQCHKTCQNVEVEQLVRYFPQVQFLDKVYVARCCTMTGAQGLTEQKTVQVPQLQCSDKGDDVPVVQVVVWVSWKVPQIQFIARVLGPSSLLRDGGLSARVWRRCWVGQFSRSSGLSRS